MERTGIVTFKGGPLTLLGAELVTGLVAPDFTCVDNGMNPVSLSDFKGELVVISSVPSLDTPVCEVQTKRFNEEAANLNCKLLTISLDLPFAQTRFCAANGIENMTTLSDYRDRSFANAWGLLIKELKLLARGVFVVGKDGNLAYQQIVGEVAEEPEYDAALAAIRAAGA
jgi:thiol peroxidase